MGVRERNVAAVRENVILHSLGVGCTLEPALGYIGELGDMADIVTGRETCFLVLGF